MKFRKLARRFSLAIAVVVAVVVSSVAIDGYVGGGFLFLEVVALMVWFPASVLAFKKRYRLLWTWAALAQGMFASLVLAAGAGWKDLWNVFPPHQAGTLPGPVVGFLLGSVAIGPVAFWLHGHRRRQGDDRMADRARIRAAEALGLNAHDPRLIAGSVGGCAVAIDASPGLDGEPATRVLVKSEIGTLRAWAEGEGEGHAAQDSLFVGDPALDGVRVAGSRVEVFAALTPEVRRLLAEAILLHGGTISDGTLEFRKHAGSVPAEVLVQAVRDAVALATALRAARARPQAEAFSERVSSDPVARVRMAALLAAGGQDPAIAEHALKDRDPLVRAAAALAVGGSALDAVRADPQTEPALLFLLETHCEGLGGFLSRALAEFGSPRAVEALARLGPDGSTALSRLRERHPLAGDAQLSLASDAGQGALAIARTPGAVSLPKP